LPLCRERPRLFDSGLRLIVGIASFRPRALSDKVKQNKFIRKIVAMVATLGCVAGIYISSRVFSG
jgi:hypothetical protein